MDNKSNYAIRSLNQNKISNDELGLSKQKVWNGISESLQERQNMKFNLFSKPIFKYSLPVLALIIFASGGFWLGFGGKSQTIKTALNNPQDATTFSVQEKSADSLAIPSTPEMKDNKKETTSDKPEQSTGKSSNQNEIIKDSDIKENLYSYSSNKPTDVAVGIRKPVAVSRNIFIKIANATERRYPALFYIGSGNSEEGKIVYEVNINTGEKKNLVQSSRPISSVVFSEKYQAIVYGETLSDASYSDIKIMVYYLNSGEKKEIGNTKLGNINIAPDGEVVGFGTTVEASPLHIDHFVTYNLGSGQTDTFDLKSISQFSETRKNATIGTTFFSQWSEKGIIIECSDYEGVWKNGSARAISLACLLDLKNSKLSIIEETKLPETFYFPMLINDKILVMNYNHDEAMSYLSENNQPPKTESPSSSTFGWLSIYNRSSDKFIDYRKETGDFIKNVLVNSNADMAIFIKQEGQLSNDTYKETLRVFNFATGETKILSTPGRVGVVGFNGNEKNILLDYHGTFYNSNIETNELTKITIKK